MRQTRGFVTFYDILRHGFSRWVDLWYWWGVNSTNILNEGLRIGDIGRRMNSKVKSVKQGGYESKRGCRTWLAFNLPHTVSSRPLYIGGQVSRIEWYPTQITISTYGKNSYFD
jgi:hypothetical protein